MSVVVVVVLRFWNIYIVDWDKLVLTVSTSNTKHTTVMSHKNAKSKNGL